MATSKVQNLDKERRNFPGPQTKKYSKLSDMQGLYKRGDKLGTTVSLDKNARSG